MDTAPETEYIKANYGACDAEPCACRKAGRTLTDCEHWHPVAATSWAELDAEIRANKGIAWLPKVAYDPR
jgi:hypothetical protein